jgi:hypothetical protein
MPRMHLSAVLLLSLACGACSRPPQPPTEQKPDPQAAQLREAIQRPIDQAKAADKATQDADAKQRAELDAAQ